MSDSWETTQKKLRKWQEDPQPWELRRILAHSDHFKIVAANAFRRARASDTKGAIPSAVSWKDWWAFYLERLPVKDGVRLLLDVWNKDVWGHRQALAAAQAHEILADVAELARVVHEPRKSNAKIERNPNRGLQHVPVPKGPSESN